MEHKSRGTKVSFHLIGNDEKIKREWDRIFTSSVEEKLKEKVYFEYFRWHLFSYNILKAKEGEEARRSFNKCIKEKIYESYRGCGKNKLFAFYQDSYDGYEIEIQEQLNASCFDEECDIYIVDLENKWTYINTHEDGIGPYYYSVK